MWLVSKPDMNQTACSFRPGQEAKLPQALSMAQIESTSPTLQKRYRERRRHLCTHSWAGRNQLPAGLEYGQTNEALGRGDMSDDARGEAETNAYRGFGLLKTLYYFFELLNNLK